METKIRTVSSFAACLINDQNFLEIKDGKLVFTENGKKFKLSLTPITFDSDGAKSDFHQAFCSYSTNLFNIWFGLLLDQEVLTYEEFEEISEKFKSFLDENPIKEITCDRLNKNAHPAN